MAANFEILQRGSTTLYGICGGIWVMTLHAKPSAADMYLARPSLKTMHQRHPDGFPTLTWVLPEAGFSMESDARRAAAEVTKEFNAAIVAMATLIEGEGFQAAAVRAIISGMDLMARASAPKKVFAGLAPSVEWCASLRPPRDRNAGAVDAVVASLAAMRKELTRGRTPGA
jgi:hypothetical protein